MKWRFVYQGFLPEIERKLMPFIKETGFYVQTGEREILLDVDSEEKVERIRQAAHLLGGRLEEVK